MTSASEAVFHSAGFLDNLFLQNNILVTWNDFIWPSSCFHNTVESQKHLKSLPAFIGTYAVPSLTTVMEGPFYRWRAQRGTVQRKIQLRTVFKKSLTSSS